MSDPRPMLLVVGAGPGVSGSLARAYASDGYDVALVGADADPLRKLADQLVASGARTRWEVADAADAEALDAAVRRLAEATGRVDVLHVNPSAFRARTPLELTATELLADVALGVAPLLTAVQAARPFLGEGGRVTATGSIAADRPSPAAASLGVQKAGLRNLVRSLDETLAPFGMRAVSVTVDGLIDRDNPDSPLHPDQIAEALVRAARQDPTRWRSEVRHPPAPD